MDLEPKLEPAVESPSRLAGTEPKRTAPQHCLCATLLLSARNRLRIKTNFDGSGQQYTKKRPAPQYRLNTQKEHAECTRSV